MGALLIALPGVTPMLGDIRKKFNIPQVDAWGDIRELLGPGEEIDWHAVRNEFEHLCSFDA
jgi:hypothetical protein